MPCHYPEEGFASPVEQWEEREAVFCDRMVESMTENALVYAEKAVKALQGGHPHATYAHLNTVQAHEIAIRAAVWQQMADHLRSSRLSRIENKRAYPGE